ncbi:deoxyribonuclease-1 [Lethenteron reissneri]|uniref:deoxyribonuclease-1 n=1 Tax=Lethenteron reissneri TaxID=7753 RepID=UPI002AB5F624|nr:deoxyribonuclease-1 [Lethenteron reissneri]XP_061412684.1 deoxyribonuclease-1 [Lethenteron reissneri]
MKLLLAAALLAVAMGMAESIRIAAFNIQTFGDAKMSKPDVAKVIVDVISLYDIVVVQEVRDSDLSAVKLLMSQLNSASAHHYEYLASDQLGSSTYTERYVYIYRDKVVSVSSSYHYDDGCESCGTDTFSREPFLVRFNIPSSAVPQLVLVPQHTSPDLAVTEIDALFDVYTDARQRWGTDSIMILGDLNADCSYVTASDWGRIRLRSDSRFSWLIGDAADTTVGTTDCAYDRIVVAGSALQGAIASGSARILNFQSMYGLTLEKAKEVSDHFPVEVTIN